MDKVTLGSCVGSFLKCQEMSAAELIVRFFGGIYFMDKVTLGSCVGSLLKCQEAQLEFGLRLL
jgi:hypothetical protein